MPQKNCVSFCVEAVAFLNPTRSQCQTLPRSQWLISKASLVSRTTMTERGDEDHSTHSAAEAAEPDTLCSVPPRETVSSFPTIMLACPPPPPSWCQSWCIIQVESGTGNICNEQSCQFFFAVCHGCVFIIIFYIFCAASWKKSAHVKFFFTGSWQQRNFVHSEVFFLCMRFFCTFFFAVFLRFFLWVFCGFLV